jgi:hypothetical protein
MLRWQALRINDRVRFPEDDSEPFAASQIGSENRGDKEPSRKGRARKGVMSKHVSPSTESSNQYFTDANSVTSDFSGTYEDVTERLPRIMYEPKRKVTDPSLYNQMGVPARAKILAPHGRYVNLDPST